MRKIGTPPSDTEYGQFLQVRKTLEKTRLQYQGLLDKCHQQQQTLSHLTAELQGSKQELATLQAALSQQQGAIAAELPIVPVSIHETTVPRHEDTFSVAKRDDLTRIQGINQRVASKLQALGIVTYRQVAEFTSDDVHAIQRVIGADLSSIPEGWVQNARSLFLLHRCHLKLGWLDLGAGDDKAFPLFSLVNQANFPAFVAADETGLALQCGRLPPRDCWRLRHKDPLQGFGG